MTMKKKIGLLVMAYGSPQTEADILPYYTHIRHGYAPTEAEVTVLNRRYQAIGGMSPMCRISEEQAQELCHQLNARSQAYEYVLYIGYKHIAPFIEDAVGEMQADGLTEAVAIALAPYFSIFSTAAYFERAKRRAARTGLVIHEVPSWNESEAFISYWARALLARWQPARTDTAVIFTAHSLPHHVLDMGDTYPARITETVAQVAEQCGLQAYRMAWQSAGVRGDWLTPDAEAVTREVVRQGGYARVLYVPLGFISDHLEILYDNDIDCRRLCESLDVVYDRVPMPNSAADFIFAMTEATEQVMAGK